MSLRVVGAGVGRTGTESLKIALERLLGGPCYHMHEVFDNIGDIDGWMAAVDGRAPDWDEFLAGYVAAVDWPASAFWRELSETYPDALVLLSVRESADVWWASASRTIFTAMAAPRAEGGPLPPGWPNDLIGATFTPRWHDEDEVKAAYLRHNDEVREAIAPDRLLEWSPGDGWEPICAALGLAVPEEPFPHANTTEAFQARMAAMRGGPPE